MLRQSNLRHPYCCRNSQFCLFRSRVRWILMFRVYILMREASSAQSNIAVFSSSCGMLYKYHNRAFVFAELLLNSLALVPVSLTTISKGRPQRFAMICAPGNSDLSHFTSKTKCVETVKIIQSPRLTKPSSDNVDVANEKVFCRIKIIVSISVCFICFSLWIAIVYRRKKVDIFVQSLLSSQKKAS